MRSKASNMSAKRLDFNAPLPEFAIYLDSSFILNFITSIQNRQGDFQAKCEKFFKRLEQATESGLCLVTSDFAIDEVCYQIIKFELENRLLSIDPTGGKYHNNPFDYYKTYPGSIQITIPKIERFYAVIETTPIMVISYRDLKDIEVELCLQVKDFIKTYNVFPADAYHVVIGKSAGVNDFVALDRDWFRVDNINLYTCLPFP